METRKTLELLKGGWDSQKVAEGRGQGPRQEGEPQGHVYSHHSFALEIGHRMVFSDYISSANTHTSVSSCKNSVYVRGKPDVIF